MSPCLSFACKQAAHSAALPTCRLAWVTAWVCEAFCAFRCVFETWTSSAPGVSEWTSIVATLLLHTIVCTMQIAVCLVACACACGLLCVFAYKPQVHLPRQVHGLIVIVSTIQGLTSGQCSNANRLTLDWNEVGSDQCITSCTASHLHISGGKKLSAARAIIVPAAKLYVRQVQDRGHDGEQALCRR